jgi:hypothetical protein
MAFFAAAHEARFEECVSLCRELLPRVDAVIIVGGILSDYVPAACKSANKPLYYLTASPMPLRSDSYVSPIQARRAHLLQYDGSERSRRINSIGWAGMDAMLDVAFRQLDDRVHRTFGLPPAPTCGWLLADRVLFACDKLLLPGPEDARIRFTQTGNLRLPGDPLPVEVSQFLENGPPVVYFGFGSFGVADPERLSEIFANAAAELGVRALIANPGGPQISSYSGTAYLIGDVSHSQLFPRLAAVMHHGGAGTTASAAWAGIPQVVFPHQFDQFAFAHRMVQLGVGVLCWADEQLTQSALVDLLRQALDRGRAMKARALSEQLQGHDGVRETMDVVEQWLRSDSGVRTG